MFDYMDFVWKNKGGTLMNEWQPVILSIKVAFMSLILVSISGISLAYWLRHRDFAGKAFLEAVLIMPLVLPPVVTGFLLLLLIGKQGPVGQVLNDVFQTQIIFTPYAAMLAGE